MVGLPIAQAINGSMKRQESSYLKSIYALVVIIIIESIFLLASCQRKEKVKVEKEIPGQKESIKPQISQGKIAIVLDDWGYTLNNLGFLKEIKEPLTLAILPRRTHSKEIADSARKLNKEAILHLPLEPHQEKKNRLEPDTILRSMPGYEILRILEEDCKSLPGIKGVSNHMGSLATESRPLMKLVLAELKKRKLYFLDSFTGKSVCRDLARNIGLPYARRQVFLDNENDKNYILAQIELLAKIARQTGYAIGIGHDRPKTLEILTKAVQDLRKRGFKFVYVSELVK